MFANYTRNVTITKMKMNISLFAPSMYVVSLLSLSMNNLIINDINISYICSNSTNMHYGLANTIYNLTTSNVYLNLNVVGNNVSALS